MFIYEMSKRLWLINSGDISVQLIYQYISVETFVLEKIIIMCIDVKILHTTRLVLKRLKMISLYCLKTKQFLTDLQMVTCQRMSWSNS